MHNGPIQPIRERSGLTPAAIRWVVSTERAVYDIVVNASLDGNFDEFEALLLLDARGQESIASTTVSELSKAHDEVRDLIVRNMLA